ncbi:transposase [Rubellimicrobium roseum]|uniref:Transposase n=1 Tax=Rubellimicrobium roseum TaxID=687525 RepID=A0A5C4N9L7_9RHOB|nr:transposase [Rubellimicrobium roseum]
MTRRAGLGGRGLSRCRELRPSGPDFVTQAVQDWTAAAGSKTVCIEPGHPWENGPVESFASKLRNEPLNRVDKGGPPHCLTS